MLKQPNIQDNSGLKYIKDSEHLLALIKEMRDDEMALLQNFDQIMSSIVKKFFSKFSSSSRSEQESVIKVLEIMTQKVLPLIKNDISKIANMAEVASFFHFKSNYFWKNIEEMVSSYLGGALDQKTLKLDLTQVSQLIRGFGYA